MITTELVAAHHDCQQMQSEDALLEAEKDLFGGLSMWTTRRRSPWLPRRVGAGKLAILKSSTTRIESGWVEVISCLGDQQLADDLTKALSSQRMNIMMEF